MALDKNDIGILKEMVRKEASAAVTNTFTDLQKHKMTDWHLYNPYEANLGSTENLINKIKGEKREIEETTLDDFADIWYTKPIFDYTTDGEDKYAMADNLYWTGWILEPIGAYRAMCKMRERSILKEVSIFAKTLSAIDNADYEKLVQDAKKKKAQETGSPGNTPEEAQHYAGQRQAGEYSKEMKGKIDFAYDHAVMDELRAREEATA